MKLSDLQQKAKNIKAVFFDIDDTLRVKNTGWMPGNIRSMINSLLERQILVNIATGRAYHALPADITSLPFDYYVTINGQHIIDSNMQHIYSNNMPNDIVEEIISWATYNNAELAYVSTHATTISALNNTVQTSLKNVYENIPVDKDFWKHNDIYQIISFSSDQSENNLPSTLQDKIRAVRWHEYSCDLILKNASKASGISNLISKSNIDPEEILVFGDALNDLEMFDFAGISVAMQDAPEILKQKATFVTKKPEENGIEFALNHLGLL